MNVRPWQKINLKYKFKMEEQNFEEWLIANVEMKRGSVLNLKDVLERCDIVTKEGNGAIKCHEASNYKNKMTDFIGHNFINVDPYYAEKND